MNKKGMTIVELIVSFSLAAVIALFLTEVVLFLRETYVNNGIKTEIVSKQALISDRVYKLLNSNRLKSAISCGDNCVELTLEDNTVSQIVFDSASNRITIGDYVTKLPESVTIGNIKAETKNLGNTENYNSIFQLYVPIVSNLMKNRNFDINVIYQYDNAKENWIYNTPNDNDDYRIIMISPSVVNKGEDYDVLQGVHLVDNNNNIIDATINYNSKPTFSTDKLGEYLISYYTMYNGKNYIANRSVHVIQTEFAYTGTEQEFVALNSGYYKLEVWGAQGGNGSTKVGGYGGYATGKVYLAKNQKLYIYVGGAGTDDTIANAASSPGGYNGGGNGFGHTDKMVGGGGGATHIATSQGLLSTKASSLSDILIVAGGGGGAAYENGNGGEYGNGGGYMGVNSNTTSTYKSTGGTQSLGGTGQYAGVFGLGASCTVNGCAGGGGGLYGGGSGNYLGGASGGSGYIGNTLLSDKYMYCYNCSESLETLIKTYTTTNVSENPIANYAKIGRGFAKITYLGQ